MHYNKSVYKPISKHNNFARFLGVDYFMQLPEQNGSETVFGFKHNHNDTMKSDLNLS